MDVISNDMKVIDSRDIIDRIEKLEELISDESTNMRFLEECKEYYILSLEEWCKECDKLKTLEEQCKEYVSDWEYGVTLIRESYFEEYMDDMIQDCYELPKDLPFWMSITYDYEALKQDYTEVDFNGIIYLVR